MNSNNRFYISTRKNKYVIWEKPIFKQFQQNNCQPQFVRTYKTLAFARKYIQTNNDDKYRVQIKYVGATNE
jgi:hypothetical protein